VRRGSNTSVCLPPKGDEYSAFMPNARRPRRCCITNRIASVRPRMPAALLLSGWLGFSTATATAPPTPAAHTLSLWLDAFNSGDRALIKSFDNTHVPWLPIERAMDLRARIGGMELLGTENSDDLWIVFRAREKATSKEVIGRLVVKPDDTAVISFLSFQGVDPGGKVEETLSVAERDRVIESAARALEELYVFPEVGKKMSVALQNAHRRGTYRAITDGQILARRLSDDLWSVGHDGHLGVRFSPDVLPADKPGQRPATDPLARERLLSDNCGFEKAEHLPPNIGYLKFNEFADPEICGPTAAAAMNFMANSDALILDLRDNHGGMSGMVTLIASYLFAEPTHLNDAYNRKENSTTQFWTSSYVPGRKFVGKPVFILTSKRTFSAAEDLSYALKNLKRATLIGETTGGGAHPIESRRIEDHFSIIVPSARSISPITKTDWEATGVKPDVEVSAAEALPEALKRARNE
jgi:retinol-binding protein 3